VPRGPLRHLHGLGNLRCVRRWETVPADPHYVLRLQRRRVCQGRH
jgi:hypothetical protein